MGEETPLIYTFILVARGIILLYQNSQNMKLIKNTNEIINDETI